MVSLLGGLQPSQELVQIAHTPLGPELESKLAEPVSDLPLDGVITLVGSLQGVEFVHEFSVLLVDGTVLGVGEVGLHGVNSLLE